MRQIDGVAGGDTDPDTVNPVFQLVSDVVAALGGARRRGAGRAQRDNDQNDQRGKGRFVWRKLLGMFYLRAY